MGYRIGIDTGGTFTDFAVFHEESGRLLIHKIPSDRGREAEAILRGLQTVMAQHGIQPQDISFIGHGTTVGTNALLEATGARVGLLITAGFRGIYEVGEQSRGSGAVIYDLFFEKPKPLVRPRYVAEIPERVLHTGEVLQPLDEAVARERIQALVDGGVEALAVCFLFSFRNPAHERQLKQLIEREFPGLDVSLSSEVAPQIRGYYRMSTTVVNAYLNPRMQAYLQELEKRLYAAGVVTPQRYVMISNGGLLRFGKAGTR
ncbi:MAG: hydantoinase/oxoprolinase family protein, partial [Alicyclobacillus sp.]|nr:hydantoinase/oxoprolinase family protein [Alicyclobacillus sp.]